MSVLACDRPVVPLRREPGVDALLATAVREVLVMRATPGGIRRVDHANLRRGVRYRVLVPDLARTSSPQAPLLAALAVAGADVRTAPDVPTDALVIDGALTVLPAEGSGIAVFRLPSVVTTTVELFERVWPGAVPLVEFPDGRLRAREQELLALLSGGSTDESAALRLGVSVRTVRRMVADLMARLGARSRFQAGVKAADRGWLLDQAG